MRKLYKGIIVLIGVFGLTAVSAVESGGSAFNGVSLAESGGSAFNGVSAVESGGSAFTDSSVTELGADAKYSVLAEPNAMLSGAAFVASSEGSSMVGATTGSTSEGSSMGGATIGSTSEGSSMGGATTGSPKEKFVEIEASKARTSRYHNSGFSYAVALGYAPMFTDYLGLNAFHCASIGLGLKYALPCGVFTATRIEIASGTMATRFSSGIKIQYNLPSATVPLYLGYDFRSFEWLSLSAYAGIKARYNRLSYTPSGGDLVLKYDYSDSAFKRIVYGASAGLSFSDKKNAPNSVFSLEYSKFFVPSGYDYYLWGLSVVYSYWF